VSPDARLCKKVSAVFLFRTTNGYRFTIDDARDFRIRIVHVADKDRFRGTDHDASRFQSHIDAMRTEVALLGRVIFGIDKDGVVRTGGDAGFAPDADRFVEIDNAIARLNIAVVGQAVTHGACAHWLQRVT